MKSQQRVGILMGGVSAEREVSIKTGRAIHQALLARGYEAIELLVDKDVDQVLRAHPIDVAFVALHGTYGEDGCVQGLLELLGIPYTGSGVLSSALAMDKHRAKQLFGLHGVKTAPHYVIDRAGLDALKANRTLPVGHDDSIGFPAFVKPRSQGSSVGAGCATDIDALIVFVEKALRHDSWALVEPSIQGREVAVAVLDDRPLGTIEITPKASFFDYASKYSSGGSEYHLPARLPEAAQAAALDLGARASASLGCSGASRVDLLVSDDDALTVLEVNTLPGMTPTSLLPKMAAHAGLDFGDLCEAILERARLERGPAHLLGPSLPPMRQG